VGAEEGWKKAVKTSHQEPVPFDEPTLGIVGMWRLGGGANPHFALALGEIMMRVGQRYIAWCAYERAATLMDHFWPDPGIQQSFVAHCRARQAIIEQELPETERTALQPRFQAELEHGRHYQEAYQHYEAERIAAGASVEDPHFDEAFFAQHGPIASPPGEADKFVARQHDFAIPPPSWASISFFAGLFAFAAAVLWRWVPHLLALPVRPPRL
jgi:hypothetical protein